MMKTIAAVVLACLIVVVADEGCKTDSPTESQPTQTNNPPVTQTVFPIGTFSATDADGRWVQNYKADSTFTLTKNGTAVFTLGRYVPSGNRVELSENSSVCSGLGNGTYTWSFNGTSLTFTVVTDRCVSRRNTLINNSWTKQ